MNNQNIWNYAVVVYPLFAGDEQADQQDGAHNACEDPDHYDGNGTGRTPKLEGGLTSGDCFGVCDT